MEYKYPSQGFKILLSTIIYFSGDSGYSLLPWVLTPIEGAAPGTPENAFNIAHVRTRNVIERCSGVLKGRFRCLLSHRVLNYSPRYESRTDSNSLCCPT
ncbi:hypothetical protein NQ315_012286 [Exocentrus adspersus]|uniref:DDE Tnp4 domain-containing protein n=1 Tax=Exocentrus adspersus TaxID=1586481 RepID=A0AAV8VEX4_9CUCU|nr:hypothetical protein NQ315_012286 [Exocentrus adspersus]